MYDHVTEVGCWVRFRALHPSDWAKHPECEDSCKNKNKCVFCCDANRLFLVGSLFSILAVCINSQHPTSLFAWHPSRPEILGSHAYVTYIYIYIYILACVIPLCTATTRMSLLCRDMESRRNQITFLYDLCSASICCFESENANSVFPINVV